MNHFDLLVPVHGLPGNGGPDGKLVTVDEGVDGVDGVDIEGEEDVESSHASTWLPYHKFAGDLQTMTGYVGESSKEDVGEAARTEDGDVGVTTWGPVQEAARSLSGESGDGSTFLLFCMFFIFSLLFSACPSVCLSICWFVYLPVCTSRFFNLLFFFACPSVCLFIY